MKKIKSIESKIAAIDLTPIRARLIRRGFTDERYVAAEKLYRKFLLSCATRTDEKSLEVSDADMDEIWHNHILFTAKYADDCKSLGCGFIHHKPSFSDSSTMKCASCSDTKCEAEAIK